MSAADGPGKFYKSQNKMASRCFILVDFSLLRGCHSIDIQDQSWFSLKIAEALKKLLKNWSVQIHVQRGKKCNLYYGYPPYSTAVWSGICDL